MNERKIIKGCMDKNAKAQRAFVDSYADFLFSICIRYAGKKSFAQDCLQESLIHILNNIHKYQDKGKFKAWCAAVTVRKCLDWLKKEKRWQAGELGEMDEPFQNENVSYRLEIQDVKRFMETIPENYRIVLNMYLVEGFSHKEIADFLLVSESTSRSLLSRGRKMIQEKFEEEKMYIIHKGDDTVEKKTANSI
ncbi:MAG: RNA polymerase sigma factor [Saprospiraceae bacterium]|nr:RNA polymerase sigma factor [Saprospiraceae bacterium]